MSLIRRFCGTRVCKRTFCFSMRRKIIYKILLRLAIGYLQGVVNLIKLNLENCLEEEIYMKKIFLQMMIVGMMLGVAGCRQKSDAESQINETNQSVEEQTNEMEKEAFILDTELLAELGVLIEEQTFDVTLNDWGKVTFASFKACFIIPFITSV